MIYEECFGGAWCSALDARYKDDEGRPTCKGCPFFKTRADLIQERINALYRLSSRGLLQKMEAKYGKSIYSIK